MKKAVEEALLGASVALEIIQEHLAKMPLEDKVDVAARLRAVVKHCNTADTLIKLEIAKQCKDKEGVVDGNIFKAIRKWIPKTVFSVTAFKEARPKLYDQYADKDGGNYQINFETR